jgi:hypothetical protein
MISAEQNIRPGNHGALDYSHVPTDAASDALEANEVDRLAVQVRKFGERQLTELSLASVKNKCFC